VVSATSPFPCQPGLAFGRGEPPFNRMISSRSAAMAPPLPPREIRWNFIAIARLRVIFTVHVLFLLYRRVPSRRWRRPSILESLQVAARSTAISCPPSRIEKCTLIPKSCRQATSWNCVAKRVVGSRVSGSSAGFRSVRWRNASVPSTIRSYRKSKQGGGGYLPIVTTHGPRPL
jgi:hypothetical protein